MSSPEEELENRLTEIRIAWRVLNKQAAALPKLDELCDYMSEMQLPVPARLFIFDQGHHSIDEIAKNRAKLIEAAEEAVNVGFSFKCIKEFVQSIAADESCYDYPDSVGYSELAPVTQQSNSSAIDSSQTKSASLAATSSQQQQQQQKPIPPPRQSLSKHLAATYVPVQSQQPQSQPQPQQQARRRSVVFEVGCYSTDCSMTSQSVQQQQQQQESAVLARNRGSSLESKKPLKPKSSGCIGLGEGSGGGGGGSGRRLLQLFVFPETRKKKKNTAEKRQSSGYFSAYPT